MTRVIFLQCSCTKEHALDVPLRHSAREARATAGDRLKLLISLNFSLFFPLMYNPFKDMGRIMHSRNPAVEHYLCSVVGQISTNVFEGMNEFIRKL
jgi:hypothetical protein